MNPSDMRLGIAVLTIVVFLCESKSTDPIARLKFALAMGLSAWATFLLGVWVGAIVNGW